MWLEENTKGPGALSKDWERILERFGQQRQLGVSPEHAREYLSATALLSAKSAASIGKLRARAPVSIPRLPYSTDIFVLVGGKKVASSLILTCQSR